MSPNIFGAYDTEICSKAINKLWLAPTELTDEEVAQLTLVDADFGDLGRRRRQGVKEDERVRSKETITLGFFRSFLHNYFFPFLGTYKYKINALEAKVLAQDKRLAEIETKSISFRGVWREGVPYGRNSAVTLKGSLWIANDATCARPGDPDEASRAWTLAVKRGEV